MHTFCCIEVNVEMCDVRRFFLCLFLFWFISTYFAKKASNGWKETVLLNRKHAQYYMHEYLAGVVFFSVCCVVEKIDGDGDTVFVVVVFS